MNRASDWAPLIVAIAALATGGQVLAAGAASGLGAGTEIEETDFNRTTKADRFDPPAESVELDNGMIIKWGSVTVAALATSTTVTFGEAFPNGTLSVEVAVDAGSALSGTSATVRNYTNTGFTIDVQCTSGLGGIIACTSDTDVSWSARGY